MWLCSVVICVGVVQLIINKVQIAGQLFYTLQKGCVNIVYISVNMFIVAYRICIFCIVYKEMFLFILRV